VFLFLVAMVGGCFLNVRKGIRGLEIIPGYVLFVSAKNSVGGEGGGCSNE
jgi:hypothetical protein